MIWMGGESSAASGRLHDDSEHSVIESSQGSGQAMAEVNRGLTNSANYAMNASYAKRASYAN